MLTSAPPRPLILRHRNALHVSRPVSQNFFPSVLRSPKWSLTLRSGPKLCVNSLRLAISSFLRTHRMIKELCSSSWSSFTGSLYVLFFKYWVAWFTDVLNEGLKIQEDWSVGLVACSVHALVGTVCVCSEWIYVIGLVQLFKICESVKIMPQTTVQTRLLTCSVPTLIGIQAKL